MPVEEISQTVRVSSARYSVHFEPGSRRVRIYDLPETMPQTPDGIRQLNSVLAEGTVNHDGIVWTSNSIGQHAGVAATWAVDYVLEADRLLVFVDETGSEDLSDPHHPVFGLGGCAIRAEEYKEIIAGPWRVLKMRHFGGLNVPLHASDLGKPTDEQIAALATFFRDTEFYRLAGVMDVTTRLDSDGFSKYDVVAGMLARNLAIIVERARPTGISVIFESSRRGDRLAKAFFGRLRLDSGGSALPATWGSMTKQRGEPGLEVADFIIHTAGTQVRARASGKPDWRKDFICVFQEPPARLVEFSHIRRFDLVRNPEGTVPGVLIPTGSVRIDPED